jgi:hypothetical protein
MGYANVRYALWYIRYGGHFLMKFTL